jgi:hypothetical protein
VPQAWPETGLPKIGDIAGDISRPCPLMATLLELRRFSTGIAAAWNDEPIKFLKSFSLLMNAPQPGGAPPELGSGSRHVHQNFR